MIGGGVGGGRQTGAEGTTSGQGRSRSAMRGEVEEELVLVVLPDDLQADRQAVDLTCRDRHRGVAGDVGRDGERPVVAEGLLEAELGDEVAVADLGRHRTGVGEGDVGVGRAEHKVDLLEEAGHLLVGLDAEHLGSPRGLEVEVVGRDVEREHDLGGQVVDAIGVAVPQDAGEADRVGHRPLDGTLGEVDDHVDPAEAGRRDERLGGSHHDRGDPRLDDRRAEVDRDHRALAGEVEAAERGLKALDAGQAQGVTRVEAVAHVVPARGVAHRSGEAPDHDGQRRLQGVGASRDPPVGRLQTEQPREAGRDPDRPTSVAPARDREDAAGHRGGGAAGGASRGAVANPRVVRRPVQLGGGEVDAAELRRGGLSREHRTGGPETGHLGRVARGHLVLEDERGLRVGPAGDGLELFDPHRHAAEGERDVGRRGGLASGLGVDVREGVEPRGVDRRERGLERLGRVEAPGPERVDQRAGVAEPGCVAHRRPS